MVNYGDSTAQQQAAHILGESGKLAFFQPLSKLLNSSDLNVCYQALIAAGKLKSPELLPDIINIFRYSCCFSILKTIRYPSKENKIIYNYIYGITTNIIFNT